MYVGRSIGVRHNFRPKAHLSKVQLSVEQDYMCLPECCACDGVPLSGSGHENSSQTLTPKMTSRSWLSKVLCRSPHTLRCQLPKKRLDKMSCTNALFFFGGGTKPPYRIYKAFDLNQMKHPIRPKLLLGLPIQHLALHTRST